MKAFFRYYEFRLLYSAAGVAAGTLLLKWLAHSYEWEAISVSPLLSGIVAADVFLIGFLLSGVLADYKESERLPGEMAASLHALADEAVGLPAYDHSVGSELIERVYLLSSAIQHWFCEKGAPHAPMVQLDALNSSFSRAHSAKFPINLTVRLKQEQANVRRLLIRIHTIRETRFVSAGYLIAKSTTGLLIVGLIFSRIQPLHEGFFLVGVITFLVVFIILLIEDIDNPFGYYDSTSTQDVSLKPIDDAVERLYKLFEMATKQQMLASA